MSALGDLVCSATTEMERALGGSVDADWTVSAGDLSWTCMDTGAHVADDLFSYASQVLAQPVSGTCRSRPGWRSGPPRRPCCSP